MRAYVDSIELDFDPVNIAINYTIVVTEQSADQSQHSISLADGSSAARDTLGAMFARWGRQIAEQRDLTVEISDDGQRITM